MGWQARGIMNSRQAGAKIRAREASVQKLVPLTRTPQSDKILTFPSHYLRCRLKLLFCTRDSGIEVPLLATKEDYIAWSGLMLQKMRNIRAIFQRAILDRC